MRYHRPLPKMMAKVYHWNRQNSWTNSEKRETTYASVWLVYCSDFHERLEGSVCVSLISLIEFRPHWPSALFPADYLGQAETFEKFKTVSDPVVGLSFSLSNQPTVRSCSTASHERSNTSIHFLFPHTIRIDEAEVVLRTIFHTSVRQGCSVSLFFTTFQSKWSWKLSYPYVRLSSLIFVQGIIFLGFGMCC